MLIFRFIYRKSDNIILSLWLFICTEYYTLSFTMLRQMIAIGCVLNAYLYIEERKKKHFLIFIIIGCLFHKTAICFIPMYFVLNTEDFLNKKLCEKINAVYAKYKLWIWAGGAVFVVVIVPYVYGLCYKAFYPYYYKTETKFNFPTLAVLILGVLLLSYLFERHFHIQERKYFNYQSCLFCAFLLQICTFKYLYLSRIALYFYIFIIVLVPCMIKYIGNKKLKKLIIISVMALSFIQYVMYSMDIYDIVPYVIGDFL